MGMLCCVVGIGGGGGANVVVGGMEELPPSDGFVVWLALPFGMEAKMVAMVMQSFLWTGVHFSEWGWALFGYRATATRSEVRRAATTKKWVGASEIVVGKTVEL